MDYVIFSSLLFSVLAMVVFALDTGSRKAVVVLGFSITTCWFFSIYFSETLLSGVLNGLLVNTMGIAVFFIGMLALDGFQKRRRLARDCR